MDELDSVLPSTSAKASTGGHDSRVVVAATEAAATTAAASPALPLTSLLGGATCFAFLPDMKLPSTSALFHRKCEAVKHGGYWTAVDIATDTAASRNGLSGDVTVGPRSKGSGAPPPDLIGIDTKGQGSRGSWDGPPCRVSHGNIVFLYACSLPTSSHVASMAGPSAVSLDASVHPAIEVFRQVPSALQARSESPAHTPGSLGGVSPTPGTIKSAPLNAAFNSSLTNGSANASSAAATPSVASAQESFPCFLCCRLADDRSDDATSTDHTTSRPSLAAYTDDRMLLLCFLAGPQGQMQSQAATLRVHTAFRQLLNDNERVRLEQLRAGRVTYFVRTAPVLRSRPWYEAVTLNIARLVSKKKVRWNTDGYDLDLAVITKQPVTVVAAGFPCDPNGPTWVESLYRNRVDDVVNFLQWQFGGMTDAMLTPDPINRENTAANLAKQGPGATPSKEAETIGKGFFVYNLCSERVYPANWFRGRFARFPFQDHEAPPLALMLQFTSHALREARERPRQALVVHCKAGKGRTGVMIVALLMEWLFAEKWSKFEVNFENSRHGSPKNGHSPVVSRPPSAAPQDLARSSPSRSRRPSITAPLLNFMEPGEASLLTQCLTTYGDARSLDGQGVTVPSQLRFLRYYERCLLELRAPRLRDAIRLRKQPPARPVIDDDEDLFSIQPSAAKRRSVEGSTTPQSSSATSNANALLPRLHYTLPFPCFADIPYVRPVHLIALTMHTTPWFDMDAGCTPFVVISARRPRGIHSVAAAQSEWSETSATLRQRLVFSHTAGTLVDIEPMQSPSTWRNRETATTGTANSTATMPCFKPQDPQLVALYDSRSTTGQKHYVTEPIIHISMANTLVADEFQVTVYSATSRHANVDLPRPTEDEGALLTSCPPGASRYGPAHLAATSVATPPPSVTLKADAANITGEYVCSFWLHSSFLNGNQGSILLKKHEIDGASAGARRDLFDDTFAIELTFAPLLPIKRLEVPDVASLEAIRDLEDADRWSWMATSVTNRLERELLSE